MIERVHEHLIGELKQNTRTDTIFIIVAILLNAAILGTNSAVGGLGGAEYTPGETLTEGSHILYVEVLGDEGWEPAGKSEVTITISDPPESPADTWTWHIPGNPESIRYQLDSEDENGWAEPSGTGSSELTRTLVMYIFILLAVFVNFAVIFGLLRGKNMRLILLGGLIRMYKDQQVEAYYDQSLLKSYTIRYYIFISVVVALGIISIAIPLIIKYL
jgi:hypothetical protein